MKVNVYQLGARRHYAVPRGFHAHDVLHRLYTDCSAHSRPWRWVAAGVAQLHAGDRLRRYLDRRATGIPDQRVKDLYWPGTLLTAGGQGEGAIRWLRQNRDFGRRSVAQGFGDVDTVYAFNGAALEIFEAARDNGLRCVLDQTAAPWSWNRELLEHEQQRWPGWEEAPRDIDATGAMAERERAEWSLADRVICGSPFVAETVAQAGGPTDRCVVVRYPLPDQGSSVRCVDPSRRRPEGPLRILFVGTLQLRKGIQYLHAAVESLPVAPELRLVGPSHLSATAQGELASRMRWLGARPRSQVMAQMDWADVLVLPTLSEGSANVCAEAQARGLPVLTTEAAGSTVRHGEDGWIVETASVEALATVLREVESIRDMGASIRERRQASNRRGLGEYGADLVAACLGDGRSTRPSPAQSVHA